ncbi:MAG: hypothetical protein LBL21_04425 [Rickettsiales bacterium]|jgi:hypothetical protein|nr:hypothetical protein [Rickettsiales bacterium]
MIKISLDLDDTIFDMEPLFRMAFEDSGVPYLPRTEWNIYEIYPAKVCDRLTELFRSPHLYKNPLLSEKIPAEVRRVYNSNIFKVHYVTERYVKNPDMTLEQLSNAKLPGGISDVYDMDMPKIQVLQQIGSALHFDDSPNIIRDCQMHLVRCVMISNDKTPYNHYLRGKVRWFPDIVTALREMCPVR